MAKAWKTHKRLIAASANNNKRTVLTEVYASDCLLMQGQNRLCFLTRDEWLYRRQSFACHRSSGKKKSFEYQDYLKKWGEVFHNTDGTELYGAPVFFI